MPRLSREKMDAIVDNILRRADSGEEPAKALLEECNNNHNLAAHIRPMILIKVLERSTGIAHRGDHAQPLPGREGH